MTHNEFRIDTSIIKSVNDLLNKYIKAINAVHELHAPDPHSCVCCDPIWCACGHKLPCPTIEAIKKELA